MEHVLIDTNVLSYIFKNDTRSSSYLPYLSSDKLLAVSFQTVAELYLWAEKQSWSNPKINELQNLLQKFIIVLYDNKLAHIWAGIVATRERIGTPISCADAWVASCALRHSATLITHNRKDFENIPKLKVISH
ncbi:twitching motility protein PilT [candidate division TA06 bacterium B3_TA06]|uniref:Twitching motility protein PilT n=1 Tax=candidate division TA06 bacterium B3_TA06 TaxID=2012487 RepID=A0A532V415_UNCT6|nr:MAG: twitching motility protein PilT [candidate division TA06 bacterium B3_TA06]